jgi:voltage-gated potassium channel
LFLITLFAILFGSLFVPNIWFENWVSPILLISNLGTGVVLVSKKRFLYIVLLVLLILTFLIQVRDALTETLNTSLSLLKLACYFLFYAIVSLEIIKQVAKAKSIKSNVILGLISGYISLGLLAFFMFLTIEIIEPNSFSGLVLEVDANLNLKEQLLYFSYVTLLTIGYGEILPISDLAQKGAILVALIGQFYLVILTAIVVGKYINQQTD